MFTLLQAGQSGTSMLIMTVAIIVIMWLFMIRPQQKKQKEIQRFRNAIAPGDNVVTAGGIYATVREINETENILVLEVAKGVTIRVDRNSVYANVQATAQK